MLQYMLQLSVSSVDKGILSEPDVDESGDHVTGIYKSNIERKAEPITPQSPCYPQVSYGCCLCGQSGNGNLCHKRKNMWPDSLSFATMTAVGGFCFTKTRL